MTRLLLCFTLVCSAIAFAQEKPQFNFETGTDFLRECSRIDVEKKTLDDALQITFCLGYVKGFVIGANMERGLSEAHVQDGYVEKLFCVSDEVTTEQTLRVVLEFIRENPTEAHRPHGVIVTAALASAFPCSAS